MEDDLNFFSMENDLNIFVNKGQPQFEFQWKMTSIILLMEDNLKK